MAKDENGVQNVRSKERRKLKVTPMQSMMSGALAGVLSRFVIAPLDVIKIRLQLQTSVTSFSTVLRKHASSQKYRTMLQACQLIIKEEGIKGLWKGNLSAEYLYLTYGAIQFYTYDFLERKSRGPEPMFPFSVLPSASHTFFCGAMAGTLATTATYPFDLLRTRFAVSGQRKIYGGLIDASRSIHASEGFRGFYRGLAPSLVQIVPQMGLIFESYRAFKSVFQSLESISPTLYTYTQASHDLLAGALAGMVSKTAVMPFDVIRKRLQVQGPVRNEIIISNVPRYTHGIVPTIAQIIRHEGFFALYKGLGPSLVKAAPSSAVTFFIVNRCHVFFDQVNSI